MTPMMPHWIDTRARTPNPLDDVLVVDDYDGEPGVVMAYMDRRGNWFISDSHTPEIPAPSHWMPLPALPVATDSPTAHTGDPT